jgi:hypothetical protein
MKVCGIDALVVMGWLLIAPPPVESLVPNGPDPYEHATVDKTWRVLDHFDMPAPCLVEKAKLVQQFATSGHPMLKHLVCISEDDPRINN